MLSIEIRDRMNSNNLLKTFVSKKNDFVKHCFEEDQNFSCDEKKVAERKSRLISRKMKEAIHSLKILYQSNKIWFIFRIRTKQLLLIHVYKFYSFYLSLHLFYVEYIFYLIYVALYLQNSA